MKREKHPQLLVSVRATYLCICCGCFMFIWNCKGPMMTSWNGDAFCICGLLWMEMSWHSCDVNVLHKNGQVGILTVCASLETLKAVDWNLRVITLTVWWSLEALKAVNLTSCWLFDHHWRHWRLSIWQHIDCSIITGGIDGCQFDSLLTVWSSLEALKAVKLTVCWLFDHHWRHWRLSIWQPLMPTVMIKQALR